jgi:hypothetical protein
MSLRRLLAILVCVLLPAAGFALGAIWPRECDDHQIDGLQQEQSDLQRRIAQLDSMLLGYRDYRKGTPIPWSADVPEQYRQEHFQSLIAAALEEIKAPVEIVDFECSEVPCIAMLRILEGAISKITTARIWQENFGKSVTGSYVAVRCQDGREERIEIIAAEWDGRIDPRAISSEAWTAEKRHEFKKRMKGKLTKTEALNERRLMSRLRRLRSCWPCAQPGGEP